MPIDQVKSTILRPHKNKLLILVALNVFLLIAIKVSGNGKGVFLFLIFISVAIDSVFRKIEYNEHEITITSLTGKRKVAGPEIKDYKGGSRVYLQHGGSVLLFLCLRDDFPYKSQEMAHFQNFLYSLTGIDFDKNGEPVAEQMPDFGYSIIAQPSEIAFLPSGKKVGR